MVFIEVNANITEVSWIYSLTIIYGKNKNVEHYIFAYISLSKGLENICNISVI